MRPICWRIDGRVMPAGESFPVGNPPVHPFCRCTIELVHIPRPRALEDVGTDYETFKAELEDVIREQREVSARHAGEFVKGSMRHGSPVELTRKFREERYRR